MRENGLSGGASQYRKNTGLWVGVRADRPCCHRFSLGVRPRHGPRRRSAAASARFRLHHYPAFSPDQDRRTTASETEILLGAPWQLRRSGALQWSAELYRVGKPVRQNGRFNRKRNYAQTRRCSQRGARPTRRQATEILECACPVSGYYGSMTTANNRSRFACRS